ncbi:MAG TPA: PucR family transcriptional regulator ligand-binding domain-containing protein [Solirubrobacteraceae bacterium]|nr:PucR family transcriptional regulator ligand-binding domain-containing protein [Solirubrobacteraceae bacterium]
MSGMTVRSALALPALRRGLPQVLAGARALDKEMRWAHVAEVRNIAELLKGGELLLTTGMDFPDRTAEQRRFVGELAERDVAALVIELGPACPRVAPCMVEEADRRDLPLVILRRGVPFVEVTEAIHSAMLAGQLGLLRRGEEIHQRFTSLMLDGEGVDTVVRVLADTIADPVILEDARGELLFHARYRTPDGEVVSTWEELRHDGHGASGTNGNGNDGAHGTTSANGTFAVDIPTGDAGGPGRLVALPLDSPLDDFDRVAVERAAGVIALASLRTNQQQLLALRERGGFLAELAAGDLTARDAQARAEGLNFTSGEGQLLPLAIALTPHTHPTGPRREAEERAAALAWRDARRDLAARNLPSLLGSRAEEGDVLALVALKQGAKRTEVADAAADAIHKAVEHHFGRGKRAIVVAGPAVRGWLDAGRALSATTQAVEAARKVPERPYHDAAAPDLERLLATLKDEPNLSEFVAKRLGPLLDHDAQRKHKLLPTLEAFCTYGGHKAETARALHLGRQALYHRLARIEDLLGAHLDDEDTRLGLHLALRTRRLSST